MKYLKSFKLFENIKILNFAKIKQAYDILLAEFEADYRNNENANMLNEFIELSIEIFEKNIDSFVDWDKVREYVHDYVDTHIYEYSDTFNIIYNYLNEHPECFSPKIVHANKQTGIFESVEALDDLNLQEITTIYHKMLDTFHENDDINDFMISEFINDVIDIFKNRIKYFDWQALKYAVGDFLSSEGTYDEVFGFVLDYLDQHPEMFSKKLEDANRQTGVFENNDEAVELWKEVYFRFQKVVETEILARQNDKLQSEGDFFSYVKNESVQRQIKRNQYIRNIVIDFFKEEGFTADWKSINTRLTWENFNFDAVENFQSAFNFVKNVINAETPHQIFLTNKLKDVNKMSGVFENERAEYLKWKRKNVTLRGIKEMNQENNAGALMGQGLYTAFLSNREMAKQYGTVRFVLNAIPKNPVIVKSINGWEMYLQRLIIDVMGKYDVRGFYKNHTIENEIMKKGHDGVIIKGREMVNYKPENVLYFSNETQLYNYWYDYYKTNI